MYNCQSLSNAILTCVEWNVIVKVPMAISFIKIQFLDFFPLLLYGMFLLFISWTPFKYNSFHNQLSHVFLCPNLSVQTTSSTRFPMYGVTVRLQCMQGVGQATLHTPHCFYSAFLISCTCPARRTMLEWVVCKNKLLNTVKEAYSFRQGTFVLIYLNKNRHTEWCLSMSHLTECRFINKKKTSRITS